MARRLQGLQSAFLWHFYVAFVVHIGRALSQLAGVCYIARTDGRGDREPDAIDLSIVL